MPIIDRKRGVRAGNKEKAVAAQQRDFFGNSGKGDGVRKIEPRFRSGSVASEQP